MPLGKCAQTGGRGLQQSGTHQLLMCAKLSAIKLNTESVLVNSKEAGFEANAGKTIYMFMCLMSMLCWTLFTEQLLYVLYTCSAASVQIV
jgi:hypothetical protein